MDAGTVKALGFLVVLGAMGISSWLLTRKARRVMGKRLGREIREGEETSLRAWMSMNDTDLKEAADQMRHTSADTAIERMERMGRDKNDREQGLGAGSDHISIR